MFFNKQKEERLHRAYEQKAHDNLIIVKQLMNNLSQDEKGVLRAYYDTYVLPIDFINIGSPTSNRMPYTLGSGGWNRIVRGFGIKNRKAARPKRDPPESEHKSGKLKG
ncbi:hypothetical protein EST38_g3001 [Candolleomyces aberdarensis]|uniref:Uncharacterized protein n=1 Tax=Candolleomyces aberdarensis TaxID=2316362 RepID=A0A4Q2DR16_9AGAR|nr:hypothetical protein EST38_g3001 [Candolleomyces aberdarensis]